VGTFLFRDNKPFLNVLPERQPNLFQKKPLEKIKQGQIQSKSFNMKLPICLVFVVVCGMLIRPMASNPAAIPSLESLSQGTIKLASFPDEFNFLSWTLMCRLSQKKKKKKKKTF
jgi:hypothetical protein